MRLVSFDVGIKNMAYCILDVSGVFSNIVDSSLSIVKWDVVNLMNEKLDKKLCTVLNITKAKTPPKVCGKNAKYEKNGTCYCNKHAENSCLMIPCKNNSVSFIKKMKLEDLKSFSTEHRIDISENDTRPTIQEKTIKYINQKTLDVINTKKTNAGELDLITIGRNLKNEMDKIFTDDTITHIIIENQISPIANRMKTIQGMLAQYFIMKEKNDYKVHIEFLSSSGKLKGFETQPENENQTEYKKHKNDAVYHCKKILEMDKFQSWKHVLETKKKDDLADCFLQAIYYLKKTCSR